MRPRIRTMRLNGPAEGESFMKREGVDAKGDDEVEWLDNEKNFEESNPDDPEDDSDNDDLDVEDDNEEED